AVVPARDLGQGEERLVGDVVSVGAARSGAGDELTHPFVVSIVEHTQGREIAAGDAPHQIGVGLLGFGAARSPVVRGFAEGVDGAPVHRRKASIPSKIPAVYAGTGGSCGGWLWVSMLPKPVMPAGANSPSMLTIPRKMPAIGKSPLRLVPRRTAGFAPS